MSVQEFTKRQDDGGYDYTDPENNDNVDDTTTDDTNIDDTNTGDSSTGDSNTTDEPSAEGSATDGNEGANEDDGEYDGEDNGDEDYDYDEDYDEDNDDDNDEDDGDESTTTTYTDETYTTTSYSPTETDSLTDTTTSYEPTPTTDLLTNTWVPTPTPIDTIISSTPTIASITSTFTTPSPTIDSGVTENANEGGLSDKNKAIIGGVVGGIGGAALLGFAAFLLISRWKRNKKASDRESFHPQTDDNVSVHSPQMSGYHDSADYSYYNTATNHSADRIIPTGTPRY